MHRTTTTATLLVTVAVSALTGCTTVQPQPGPASATARPPSAPRPDGRGAPRVVQAPAREALELTGPSPRADGEPSRERDRRPSNADARPAAPLDRPRAPQRPHQRPAHPEQRPRHQRSAPHAEVPRAVQGVPSSQADVCALGRRYGGWPADSPQSVVCDQTYAR